MTHLISPPLTDMGSVSSARFSAALVVGLLCALLMPELARSQTPNITNGTPAESFAGEQFCFDTALTNVGAPGFGPYLRLLLPPEITFDSSTFLGSAPSSTTVGTFPPEPGNQLTDPLLGTTVSGPAGGSYVQIVLPLGSVVAGGPGISTEICATLSTTATIGVPLDVTVQPVFRFGDTATGENGPILGATDTQPITPTLIRASKASGVAEGERVPGAAFPYTYTFTVDVANGQTVHNVIIADTLPPDVQYVGPAVITGGTGATLDVEPSTSSPGGALSVSVDSITGTLTGVDVEVSFPVHIVDTLDETACVTELQTNALTVDAEFPLGVPLPQLTDFADVTAKHVAIQKGAAPGTMAPGDTVTFTINFQVTEFGVVSDLVLTDVLEDGFTFANHQSLTVGGAVAIVPSVVVDGSGVTTITYDVGAVTGDISGPATGTITYTATVDQRYTATGLPINAADTLGSNITGDYDLLGGATNCSDDSAARVVVEPTTIQKSIITAQTFYQPGESITFRLSQSIPSGDTRAVVFEDFFPLPVLDVTGLSTTYGVDIVRAATDTLGLTPLSISTSAATNSVRIEFPDIDTTTPQTLAVDINMTIVDEPFADDLFLTNLFQATNEDSVGAQAIAAAPAQFAVGAPELVITKGVSASDNPTADATISPSPAVTPVDGAITQSDADDTLTYQLTLENQGGAPAFDVIVTDPALPGLTSGTIVSVENSAGNPIAYRDPADVAPPASPGLPIPTDLSNGILLDEPVPRGLTHRLQATIAASLFTDGNGDSNPDPGDVLEFTVFVLNNDNPVTNAQFDITLPGDLTYVGSSLTSDRGTVDDILAPDLSVDMGALNSAELVTIRFRATVGADPSYDLQGSITSSEAAPEATDANDNFADGSQLLAIIANSALPSAASPPSVIAERVLVTVTYTLEGSVQPGQVIPNTATASWASQPGAGRFSDVSDDTSVTIASPQIDKTVLAIAPGYAGNLTEAQIGEVITYQVVITLPEGVSQSVSLTDLLDNGLALTDMVSITPSSVDVTTDSAGGFAGVLAGAVFSNQGAGSHQRDRLLTLGFGNVTNANTDDATAETITTVYRARVLNWSDNSRGNDRNNRATWTWDNPAGGTLAVSDNAPNVTIIEPELSLTKAITQPVGDAGDVLTVTLDIAHLGPSDGDAFDVTIEDILPTGFTFGSFGATGGVAPTTGPSHSSGTISASWDVIPDGGTAQIIFTVTLDGVVSPQQVIENTAELEWESLLTADEGALPSPPNNTLGIERTGNPADPGGAANDYNDSDADDSAVPAVMVAKTVDGISPGGASPGVTVGDRITYRIIVTPPEGATDNLVIIDTLPAGFSFQSAMLDTTGFNGSVSLDSALVTGGTVDGGQQVTITMGATTTVTGDNNPANNSFAVDLEALVADSASNAAVVIAQNKTNTATVTYTGSMGTIEDAADVVFVEPDLEITKVLSPDADLEAGDTVTITLTVTNNGTSPAYDVVITDTLNDDGALFDLTSVAENTTPAGYSYSYSDPTVTISADAATSLSGGGASAVFTFTAEVAAGALTGSTYGNTASVIGNGNDGVASDPERDTTDTGSDTATTDSADASKSLIASSEAWTSDAAPIAVAIGELLTFRLAFDIPEGVTRADGTLVVDTLPPGYRYQTGTGRIRAIADTGIFGDSFSLEAWGYGDTSTLDRTLRRQATVCAGDTDTADGFNPSAAWDGVAGDSFGGLGSHSVSCGVPADILISEYVEGTGSNQAIELFNGTGGLIDLGADNYILEFYADGSAVATATVNLTGTVADSSTYVVGNSAAAVGITGVSDQTDASLSFDGNDVVVLKSGGAGGTTLDVIGQIGPLNRIPEGEAALEPTVNGNDLEFDLGDLTNADNDSSTEQVLIEYTVLAENTADNNRSDTDSNTGTFNYLNRDGMGQMLSQSVSWTVQEPSALMNKLASPTTVQGGETVTYTVRLTNLNATDGTRGWEPTISDDLPAEMQNLLLTSATLSRGALDLSPCVTVSAGEIIDLDLSCLALSERYLAQGEFIEVVYTADVDPTISFEQQVTNTARGELTSLPGTNGTGNATPGTTGDVDGERTGTGAGENDLSDSDSSTVTAGRPTITKTGDASLQIGETTIMTLSVDFPVGTTNAFVITDNLPAGLRYTSTINITSPAMDFSASNNPVAPAAGTDPLVFDFGTITNSAASAQTLTISYEVQVENVIGNQNGTTLDNSATLSYDGAAVPFPTDSARITVIEPDLEVAKTITSGAAGSDAGDMIGYQFVVENTSATATAYRVDLEDVLPAELLGGTPSVLNISLTNPGGAAVRNADAMPLAVGDAILATTTNTDDTLTWPLFDLPPSTALTIAYDVVVIDLAVAGGMLTNDVSATYDSLVGGGGRDSGDSSDDDDGNLDNYGETDDVTLTLSSALAIQKALNAVHATNDFTIGDLVTFDLRVDLIEGVTTNVVVTDVLPDGLDFEGPVRIVAGPNVSYAGGGAAVEAPAGTLTIDLGDVTNAPDGSTANDFLIIEVDARMLDIPGNMRGTVLTNSVSVTSDQGVAGPDTAAIDVVEAVLNVTKTSSNAIPALGEAVTWTITVQHDMTSGADAFDVVLMDVIPAGLTYVPGSTTGDGSVNETDPGEPVFTLNTITLVEMSKSFTFQTTVDLDATVDSAIDNIINLDYDGQAGTPAIERAYTGAGTGSVTPATPAFVDAQKTVAIAVDGGTAGVVDVGDTLEYTVVLTNSGPTVTNAVFTDTLPPETSYVAASLASSSGTPDDSMAPDLSVDLGTLVNGAMVTITFRVTVDGGTPVGTIISNQGLIDSDQTVPEPTDVDGVDANGDQPTDIPVGGGSPVTDALYAMKGVDLVGDNDLSGSVTPNDTLEYFILLSNEGPTALTGVTVTDTIPTGLTYVPASADAQPVGGSVSVAGVAVSASFPSIGVGQTALISFQVTVDDPLVDLNGGANDESFTNQAVADSDQTDPVLSDGNGDPTDGNQPTMIQAVDMGAGAPAIDVEKRWSQGTDLDGDGLVDPLDEIDYRIVVTNTGSAPATNVRLTDVTPVNTTFVLGSATTSQGAVSGEAPLMVNIGTLEPGGFVVIGFSVMVDGGTPDGTIVANQANVTGDGGINEDSDDNGTDGDGKNPTLTPVDTGGGSAVGSPGGLTKSLIASSEADSTDPQVQIGEVLTYRLGVDVPAGTLREVSLIDTLPAGLTYLPGTAQLARVFETGLNTSRNPGSVNAAPSGTYVPLSDGSEFIVSGNELSLFVGDVINSDNDMNAEQLLLEIDVLVENVAGNQAGTALTNQGSLSYFNQLGQLQTLTPVGVTATVVEPDVAVAKSASPAGITTSGGSVQYTIVIAGQTGATAATAYDLQLTDTLPPQASTLTIDSITPTGGASGITDNSAGTTIGVSVGTVPPGGSVTVVYTASYPAPQVVGVAVNTADVSWTSLPGNQGTGDATPGNPGDTDGERTGSGTGPNDLSDTDTASLPIGALALDKSIQNPQVRYAVGDVIDYQVVVTVPPGVSLIGSVLSDVLDEGLEYVTGSYALSLDAGLSTTMTPTDFMRTDDTPLAGQETLSADLGTLSNTTAAMQALTLTYQAGVENVLSNQDNQGLDNTVTLAIADTGGGVPDNLSDTTSSTVGEPRLVLTKAITSPVVGLDAGDPVSFEVTVGNTGTTTAFEVVLSDLLPAGLENASNLMVTSTVGGAETPSFTNNGTDWSTSAFDVPVGGSVTVAFDAELSPSVVPGQVIQNSTLARFTSRDGVDPNERDGSDSGSDQDDGNLNNYNEGASASAFTVADRVQIDKGFWPDPAADRYTIGQVVTYRVTASFIEGTVADLVVVDVLPPDLRFESALVSFGNLGMSAEMVPTGALVGSTLTFDFGDVSNPSNGSDADDFLTIDLQVTLLDVPGNVDGTVLGNNASLTFTGVGGPETRDYDADAGTPGIQPLDLTVIEPALGVTKVPNTPTPALGDIVTWTVTVQHQSDSTADAFDVILSDAIPAGLTYVPGSRGGDGSVDETIPSIPLFNLGVITLAEGSKTFTFDTVVDLDATVGEPITNSIGLAWDTRPDSPPDERGYGDASSGVVTPGTPAFVDAQKTVAIAVDGGTAGVVDVGDTLEYTVVLTNSGPTVTNAVFTDTLPPETSYVAASLASSSGTPDDSMAPDLSVDLGTLVNGAMVTITFRVTVDGGTPVGTIISNQGLIDSDQTVPEPTDVDGVDANGDQPTDIPVGGGSPVTDALYAMKGVDLVGDNDLSGSVTPNDTLEYFILLSNEGPTALTGVTVTDTIPTGLTYVPASADAQPVGGSVSVAGVAVSASFPSIGVGQTALISFQVTVDDPLVDLNGGANDESFTNQAVADSDQTDPVLSDGNGDPTDGNQPTMIQAVDMGAGAPAIDVEKRWSQGTDLDGDGLVDPLDEIDYRIVVTNTGSAPATNVRLTDVTPVNTTFVLGSATTSQGAVSGEAPLMVNIGTLEPGGFVVIGFSVMVDGGTPDGTIVANQANVTGDGGINEDSDDNGTDGDGKNPTLTPVDTGGGSAVGSPGGLTKSLIASSEADSTDPQVQIGEVLTYRLGVDVPAGTLREVSLIDTLPAGLTYLPGTAQLARVFETGLNTSRNPGSVNAAPSGTYVPLSDGSEFIVSGNELSLFVGDVINSDNDMNAEQLLLEIDVLVENVAGNQAGTALTNQGSLSYFNQLGQLQTLTPVGVTATVVEPDVAVAKSASPAGITTSGGSVQYTIVIAGQTGATAATAYDLQLTDTLPPQASTLTIDSITPTGGASGITDNSAGTTIGVSVGTVPPGGSVTVVYTASYPAPQVVGVAVNTADVSWTSLPGNQGTGDATPGNPGDTDGERTGSGTGPNDLSDTDTASLPIGALALDKSIQNPQVRYAVGDVIDYQVVVTVPPGVSLIGSVLSDVLDEGLEYVTGSYALSLDAGLSTTMTPTDFMRTDDTPLAGQETLSADLGTLSNTTAAMQALTLTYQAGVENVLSNQDNQGLDNTVTLAIADTGGGVPDNLSDTTSSTVGEPRLVLTKAITSPVVGLDAGDPVSFEVTVGNTGTTTAFEVVLSDLLPAGLENASNLMVTSTVGGAETPSFTNNGTDWSTSAFDVPVGGSVTVAFDAELSPSVVPGQVIQNSTLARFTSRDGVDPNERDGSDSGSDQDDGNLNNYNEGASASAFTVADRVQIDKGFWPDPAADRYTIGQVVTYRLTVSLLEGTLPDLVVVDVLSDSVRFEDASASFGNLGMTAAQVPTGADVSGTVTFDFGTVTNPPNGNAADDFLTIDLRVTVLDVPTNLNGTVLGNNASLTFTGVGGPETRDYDADAGTPGIQPLDLTVIEPDVQLLKSVGPTNPAPGALLRYTLVLDHTAASRAGAFDLQVVDTLPGGLTYVPGSASPAPASVSGQVLSFEFAALTLADDQTTISYEATVDATQGIGADLTNVATLGYSTLPDGIPDERTYSTGGGATVTVSDEAPDLSIVKDDDGVSTIPGGSVVYTLSYANVGSLAATGVVITESVPANTRFDAAASTAGWVCSPDALPDAVCILSLGDLAVDASGDVLFGLQVDTPVPAGTNAIDNSAAISDDGTRGIDRNPDNNADQDTTPLVTAPTMELEKRYTGFTDVDGSEDLSIGDILAYIVLATNTGDVELTNVTVSDSQLVPDSALCPLLTVGATCELMGTYVLDQADVDAGGVDNTASVVSDQTPPVVVTVTVPIPTSSGLALVKSATTGVPFVAAGDIITYEYLVQNTGTVTITDPIVVTDDRIADVACPVLPVGGLAPGASITCTASYTVTEDDLLAEEVTNIAVATSGVLSSPPSTVTVPGSGADLAVVKTAPPFAIAGASITYTLRVRNAGPSRAIETVLDDPTPAGLTFLGASAPCQSGFPCSLGDLDRDAEVEIQARYLVEVSDGNPLIENMAVVTSSTPDPNPIDNVSTTPITVQPPVQVPVNDPRLLILLTALLALCGGVTLRRRTTVGPRRGR